jgi:hypothetical protein
MAALLGTFAGTLMYGTRDGMLSSPVLQTMGSDIMGICK